MQCGEREKRLHRDRAIDESACSRAEGTTATATGHKVTKSDSTRVRHFGRDFVSAAAQTLLRNPFEPPPPSPGRPDCALRSLTVAGHRAVPSDGIRKSRSPRAFEIESKRGTSFPAVPARDPDAFPKKVVSSPARAHRSRSSPLNVGVPVPTFINKENNCRRIRV